MEIIHRDTDYAIRALAHLAASEDMLSVTSIAEHINVPVDFLRKIMQHVKAAGLVQSVRGPFGGYSLTRAPENIRLQDIIAATQGPLRMNACFADPGVCENSGGCEVQNLLGEVEEKLRLYLEDITLADIAKRLENT